MCTMDFSCFRLPVEVHTFNPSAGGGGKHKEFKVIHGYIVSQWLAWGIGDTV